MSHEKKSTGHIEKAPTSDHNWTRATAMMLGMQQNESVLAFETIINLNQNC